MFKHLYKFTRRISIHHLLVLITIESETEIMSHDREKEGIMDLVVWFLEIQKESV